MKCVCVGGGDGGDEGECETESREEVMGHGDGSQGVCVWGGGATGQSVGERGGTGAGDERAKSSAKLE